MIDLPGYEVAQIGVRLLDDAYTAWFMAEHESEHALRAWRDAVPRDRRTAYLSYRAALDREEAAAYDLQRLSDVSRLCEDRLANREEVFK